MWYMGGLNVNVRLCCAYYGAAVGAPHGACSVPCVPCGGWPRVPQIEVTRHGTSDPHRAASWCIKLVCLGYLISCRVKWRAALDSQGARYSIPGEVGQVQCCAQACCAS